MKKATEQNRNIAEENPGTTLIKNKTLNDQKENDNSRRNHNTKLILVVALIGLSGIILGVWVILNVEIHLSVSAGLFIFIIMGYISTLFFIEWCRKEELGQNFKPWK